MAKPKRYDASFKLTLRSDQLTYLHQRAETSQLSVSEFLRTMIEKDRESLAKRGAREKGKRNGH